MGKDKVAAGVKGKSPKAGMVDPKGAWTKVQERTIGKMKMGGAMKKDEDNSSFAKLAPPYDKATFADKIAGATKGKAKSGAMMKKGGTMKKAMMGSSMMQSPMMKKGGKMSKKK